MKIGIVASAKDMLSLFKILSKYDHEYYVWYDSQYGFRGDKSADMVQERITIGKKYLEKKGVDCIIIPPVYELLSEDINVLKLFETYLLSYAFQFSLIGKIGLIGDYTDIKLAKTIIPDIEKKYKLTDNQSNISKFHKPLVYRYKEVQMWKYFLTTFSYSNYMVNKTIKFDLRYFKDAGVDTVVPLNYGYFNYQRTISKYFNFNKTRFHQLEKLEEIFCLLCPDTTKYSINIMCNSNPELITRDRKLMYILQRGKSVEIRVSNS